MIFYSIIIYIFYIHIHLLIWAGWQSSWCWPSLRWLESTWRQSHTYRVSASYRNCWIINFDIHSAIKWNLLSWSKWSKSLYCYVDVLYWCIRKKEFFTWTVSCCLVPFILIFSYLLGLPIILFACLTADISLLEELDHLFIHLRATMQLSSAYRCQETLLASLLTLFLPFVFHNILQELHFHFSVFRFVAIPVVSSQGICFWKLCRGWLTKHLGSWKGVNI